MGKIKIALIFFIFGFVVNHGVQVSAGIASFKTALVANVTANFTVPERQKITDTFVTAYQSEWNARVAAGTVDNATNRGNFVADKVIDYIQGIVRAEQHRTNIQAVALPTPLPQ